MLTLTKIVNNYILKKKEEGNGNFDTYLLYAISACRQLNVYANNTFKSVVLNVDSTTNTAQLPSDYVDFVKIATCIGGKMYTLDYRRDLCTATEETVCDQNGNVISEQDRLAAISSGNDSYVYSSGYEFCNVWNGGSMIDRIFSLGAGFPTLGLYKIDKDKRRIHFAALASGVTEIVLEYKSNGLTKGAEIFLDELFEEPIHAYIRYQIALDNDSPNIGAKKAEWMNKYNQLKGLKYSTTIEQLIKISRKSVAVGNLAR